MNNILEIVNNISNVAVAKKMLISTAESCTGGLISKYLTDLDGSSLFFDSSIVVYSNDSKISLLRVKKQTLLQHGAVSKAVVEEMSSGLLKNLQSSIAVSVSGIMGSLKNDTDKEAGSVWICIMSDEITKTYHTVLTGTRIENREKTAKIALLNLYDFIKEL